MGRKRKTPSDWALEYTDFKVYKTENNTEENSIVCRYCCLKISVDVDKKPYDRIKEHIASARHKKLRESTPTTSREQPTLKEILLRQKEKEKTQEGAIYDFVRAVCYAGLSLRNCDGPIGDFVKRYCPATKTMPKYDTLLKKYLPEVYKNDFEKIKELVRDSKISLVVDESHDIVGRPTVNTMITFYNKTEQRKNTFLIDVSFVTRTNSVTIAKTLGKALEKLDKSWSEVLCVATDSAEYMKLMVSQIKSTENIPTLLHITDISHLIHVCVENALQCPEMIATRKFVIKLGAVFKHSPKMFGIYLSVCESCEISGIKPPAVVPVRWSSFYESLKVTIKMWRGILRFFEHPELNTSQKVSDIKEILDSIGKNKLYALLLYVEEVLTPINSLQKELESNRALLHKINHFINISLEKSMNRNWKPLEGNPCSAVMETLSQADSTAAEVAMKQFTEYLSSKWSATTRRNINESARAFWKSASAIDPFKKSICDLNADGYETLLCLCTNKTDRIKDELESYFLEPPPSNLDLNIMQFWTDAQHRYPELSEYILLLLCMPTGSCDVERSFSHLRHLQTPQRCNMTEEKLCMELILYVNNIVNTK